MKFLKKVFTKNWSCLDVALIKWSACLFGMIIGAIFPQFILKNIFIIIILILLLIIHPMISIWRTK